MNADNPYVRYSNSASEKKLSERLGIHWSNDMQDWDLIVSDYGRISDFLKVYQNELKDDDDKFALMQLIISSFDDGISSADSQELKNWNICKTILTKECYLHYSIIEYWSLLDNEIENTFSITPFIREIWKDVASKFE